MILFTKMKSLKILCSSISHLDIKLGRSEIKIFLSFSVAWFPKDNILIWGKVKNSSRKQPQKKIKVEENIVGRSHRFLGVSLWNCWMWWGICSSAFRLYSSPIHINSEYVKLKIYSWLWPWHYCNIILFGRTIIILLIQL